MARQISLASHPAASASLTVKEPIALSAISCEKEAAQLSPNESVIRSHRSEFLIANRYFILKECTFN